MKTTYEATKKAAELLKRLNEGTQSYILLKTIISRPKAVEQLAERIKTDDTKKAETTATNNARWYVNQLVKAGGVKAIYEKAEKKSVKKANKKSSKKVRVAKVEGTKQEASS